MVTQNIILSGVDDVKKFVNFVSDYNFKIELVSGRYAVDAKSIMGIFSLDLDKPVKMNAYTDDEGFIRGIKSFMAM
ncbi:MAG: HPr family phosphocarrier protein [Ruminococcus sp.]|nr:HPr family phosphocarrier protein [Ruminococcus sp.]